MTPLILVDRIDEKPDSTRSKIYIASKPTAFVALEDIVRKGLKVPGETAIDAGVYPLRMGNSPRFSHEYYTKDNINLIARKDWEKLPKVSRDLYHEHEVVHVDNVPNFAEILHHFGNTCFDTKGCLIIGSKLGMVGVNTAVLASRDAYVKYYAQVAPLIRKGEQFVEYRNSFAA